VAKFNCPPERRDASSLQEVLTPHAKEMAEMIPSQAIMAISLKA